MYLQKLHDIRRHVIPYVASRHYLEKPSAGAPREGPRRAAEGKKKDREWKYGPTRDKKNEQYWLNEFLHTLP